MVSRPAILPAPLEHMEQAALLDWWDWQAKARGLPVKLLMAIPNGEARSMRAGVRLKMEGVRRGVPDLLLAIPKGGKGGLWIEMKRRTGGKLSLEQKEMLGLLEAQGYAVCVCRGYEAAKKAICRHLGWALEASPAMKQTGAAGPWGKWGGFDED